MSLKFFIIQVFHLLGCPLDLAQISSSILNSNEENGKPCLLSDFSRIALHFSLFKLVLAMGLLQTAFIMLRYVLFILNHSMTINMKECWILSMTLSCI